MDNVDRAKQSELRQRQAAVDAARTPSDNGEQLIVDGAVLCIDCREPIPEERLAAFPQAVRCVECKEYYEHEQARGLV